MRYMYGTMTSFISSTFLLLSLIKYIIIQISELPKGKVLPVLHQLCNSFG